MANERIILIHYSEVGLKGRNQPVFFRRLIGNLHNKLASAGIVLPIRRQQGQLVIRGIFDPAVAHQVLSNVKDVPGVAWCAEARCVSHSNFLGSAQAVSTELQLLEENLLDLCRSTPGPGTFAVRVNRAAKNIPFRSPDLERRFGKSICEQTAWQHVQLRHPQVTFHIDLQPGEAFLFSQKLSGPGGLPVGSAGRVLVLLSGGIDSPVAAFLMARRGCHLDFLHFTATGEQQAEAGMGKMGDLVRMLTRYCGSARLYVAPYTRFDVSLLGHDVPYDLVLFRRFMLRVGERLARRIGAQALVTGDNLSQVASQTLSNLVATTPATAMPVFRPLLGFNKEEIVARAEQLGTYALSIQPYKDCCALMSQHPRTKSSPAALQQLEQAVFPDYPALVDATLAEAVCHEVPCSPAPPVNGHASGPNLG